MNVRNQWRVQLTDAIIDDSYSQVHLVSSATKKIIHPITAVHESTPK